ALRAEPVIELAANPGAERAGDRKNDAEGADLDGIPSERTGRIDPAESKQRHQSVGVNQVGEQERRHRPLLWQLEKRLSQLAQCFAQCSFNRSLVRLIGAQEAE